MRCRENVAHIGQKHLNCPRWHHATPERQTSGTERGQPSAMPRQLIGWKKNLLKKSWMQFMNGITAKFNHLSSYC